MTAIIATAFASNRGAAYKACELIIARGPQTIEQLMVAIDFGAHGTRKAKIRAAIQAGWMCETGAGTIDVTDSVRQHFAALEPKERPLGQITPTQYRGDWRKGSLSAKNIPSRHGLRPASDAAPAWSVRENPHFHTKG